MSEPPAAARVAPRWGADEQAERPRNLLVLLAYENRIQAGVDHRDIAEQAIAPLAVRQLLTVLDLRSRHVIVETYLHDRSVADVGRELGITESRVYQIRTAALRAMRSAA